MSAPQVSLHSFEERLDGIAGHKPAVVEFRRLVVKWITGQLEVLSHEERELCDESRRIWAACCEWYEVPTGQLDYVI
jgi:hypothetical protein